MNDVPQPARGPRPRSARLDPPAPEEVTVSVGDAPAAVWRTSWGARLALYLERTANLLGVILPAVAVVVAAVLTWKHLTTTRDLVLLAVMYLVTAVGLTVGFHRMLTHRGFEAQPAVRFVLLALGCMAGMSDPVSFAATHLRHHARSDRRGDPHSPADGMFHAHVGWFLMGFEADPQTYARWLLADPMVRFFRRTAWYWTAVGFAIPFAIGGWTALLWGGWVRYFLTIHVTFSINSICHRFGRVDFETGDNSRNEWVLGVVGLGEGWHNNHHAFPRSPFHGLRWWQIDIAGYIIAGLARLGLAHNLYRVSPDARLARRVVRSEEAR